MGKVTVNMVIGGMRGITVSAARRWSSSMMLPIRLDLTLN